MTLADSYRTVRAQTLSLIEPFSTEDLVVQSMPDASPAKWHLAHTTWFFETFVIKPRARNYRSPDPSFAVLFNSYYNGIGEQFSRERRGTQSRPSVSEVLAWRKSVDEAVIARLDEPEVNKLVELGLHHEQQHQELLVMDIKHALAPSPAFFGIELPAPVNDPGPLSWKDFDSLVCEVGSDGTEFCFDNETPIHNVLVPGFALANRPSTNREYLAFIEDQGYQRHELWLSDAFHWLKEARINSPLYWRRDGETWRVQTLAGETPLDLDAPVCHLSFFEADAFSRWSSARLPTEFEWEHASAAAGTPANFLEDGEFAPSLGTATPGAPSSMLGGVWEWTSSAYRPYPGYRPLPGALGEYNGKFMNGQYVLRGGSCATPREHIRASYRNFFPPTARWLFSGVRLAKDAG